MFRTIFFIIILSLFYWLSQRYKTLMKLNMFIVFIL